MKASQYSYKAKAVEFRMLWLSIEQFIGNAFIPLFAEAQNIREFIANIDSQSNPIYSVIKESYDKSQCNELNSPIDPFIILDILGESLYFQKQQDYVDAALIDQIERIGLHICKKFIFLNDALPQNSYNNLNSKDLQQHAAPVIYLKTSNNKTS